MIRQNSTFVSTVISELKEKQGMVFGFFEAHSHEGYTTYEMAVMLGMQVHTLSPRVTELRDLGLLLRLPKRKCSISNRLAHPHRTLWVRRHD